MQRRTLHLEAGECATQVPLGGAVEEHNGPVLAAVSPQPTADRPVGSTLGRLWAFLAAERAWVLHTAALILLWTVELYLVQWHTLISPNETGWKFQFFAPKVRFVFDFLFVSMIVLSLRRRLLVPVIALTFLVHLGLVTYFHFFLRPLSILTVVNNWSEGKVIGQFAMHLFPQWALLALAAVVGVKLYLIYRVPRPEIRTRVRLAMGGMFAAAYCVLFAAAHYVDPLDKIMTTRSVGRLGIIRGYTGPWLAEMFYLGDDQVLQRAVELRSSPSDHLSPIEASIPIRKRLIIIQAESLDFNVLGYRAGGQEVTPFLNELRKQSMFYRVRAFHTIGSADADFVVLNNARPSPHVVGWKIAGYPYKDTLPEFLGRYGYRTSSFHGLTGTFYDRRGPYEQMPFAEVHFEEEMVSKYGLPSDRWGVRDAQVLDLSKQLLKQSSGEVCHFIITLTTHTPYTSLTPEQREIFAEPRSLTENYLNNMRYLDNCLRDYLSNLRDATVVIYSDHSTDAKEGDFKPDRDGPREYIPCFIYDTEEDLSQVQQTRNQPIATSGELNLLDVMTYVRRQVAASRPLSADASANSP